MSRQGIDVATSFMSLQLSIGVFLGRDINPLSQHHFMPLQVLTDGS